MLQKLSSTMALPRIGGLYAAWSKAAENRLREADYQGWSACTSLPKSTCSVVSIGLKAMQKDLARPASGDQLVFNNYVKADEFSNARTILFSAASYLYRIERGEDGIGGKHTPF